MCSTGVTPPFLLGEHFSGTICASGKDSFCLTGKAIDTKPKLEMERTVK